MTSRAPLMLIVATVGCGELVFLDRDAGSSLDASEPTLDANGGDMDASDAMRDDASLDSGNLPELFAPYWTQSGVDAISVSELDAFDFDGDGKSDLTLMGASIYLFSNVSAAPLNFGRVFSEVEFYAAHTYGGGWLDVLSFGGTELVLARNGSHQVWRINEVEALELVWSTENLDVISQVVSNDFDNDGDTDWVAVGHVTQVFRNVGAVAPDALSDLPTAEDGAFGDLDQDELPDLALCESTEVVVYEFDGAGAFTVLQRLPFTGPEYPHAVDWGDYDSDGDDDLIVVAGGLRLFANDLPPTAPSRVLVPDGIRDAVADRVFLRDMNHDDREDLILSSGIVFLQGDTPPVPHSPSWDAELAEEDDEDQKDGEGPWGNDARMVIGDFDGDTWLDLAIGFEADLSVRYPITIYRNQMGDQL